MKPIDWMVTAPPSESGQQKVASVKPSVQPTPVRPDVVEVTATLQKVEGKEGHSAGYGFKFETFYDTGTYIVSLKPGLPADQSTEVQPRLRVVNINGRDVSSGLFKADVRSMILKAGNELNLGLMDDAASYAGRKQPKTNFDTSGRPHAYPMQAQHYVPAPIIWTRSRTLDSEA